MTPPPPELLRAITDRPEDDQPRLAYADWLDGVGLTGRADFLRRHARFERLPGCGRCGHTGCVGKFRDIVRVRDTTPQFCDCQRGRLIPTLIESRPDDTWPYPANWIVEPMAYRAAKRYQRRFYGPGTDVLVAFRRGLAVGATGSLQRLVAGLPIVLAFEPLLTWAIPHDKYAFQFLDRGCRFDRAESSAGAMAVSDSRRSSHPLYIPNVGPLPHELPPAIFDALPSGTAGSFAGRTVRPAGGGPATQSMIYPRTRASAQALGRAVVAAVQRGYRGGPP